MKTILRIASLAVLAVALLGSPLRADRGSAGQNGLGEQVRHELVMLPFYSVFDDFNFEVHGDTVRLTGKVTSPTLKSDAETVVQRIPGVSKVVNEIEVLPLSGYDNQVRRALYVKLFNPNSPLFRYSLGSDPSIHIIVDNGHVTLKGYVSSEADKNMATLLASQVFGAFSVTNELVVPGKAT